MRSLFYVTAASGVGAADAVALMPEVRKALQTDPQILGLTGAPPVVRPHEGRDTVIEVTITDASLRGAEIIAERVREIIAKDPKTRVSTAPPRFTERINDDESDPKDGGGGEQQDRKPSSHDSDKPAKALASMQRHPDKPVTAYDVKNALGVSLDAITGITKRGVNDGFLELVDTGYTDAHHAHNAYKITELGEIAARATLGEELSDEQLRRVQSM